MFCKNCGREIDDKALACPNCGIQVGKVNGEIHSNVFAIIGFIFSDILPIVGLVFSIMGYNKAKKEGAPYKRLALAGIGISIAVIVLVIIYMIIYCVTLSQTMSAVA